ncbi:thioredoxin [Stylonychia lemnae]|uniref:Thioredoxin n=1 Tax=Stylonychia lemnae TaxID=5949 RepID=A0A078AJK2_STYLE|nr:thioredoxin [Stylonychia lemnae]|eukprot:CDW81652.1 thioredoxin [Stylonychia lemnae]
MNYILAGDLVWPQDLKGNKVKTMKEIKDYVQSPEGGNGKAAVFTIFYQQSCRPCYEEMPIWNAAVDQIQKEYPGQVAFIKVDTKSQKDVLGHYNVRSTPKVYFCGVAASDEGINAFNLRRTYENHLSWMREQVEKYVIKPEAELVTARTKQTQLFEKTSLWLPNRAQPSSIKK